jgi:hypothetical protein
LDLKRLLPKLRVDSSEEAEPPSHARMVSRRFCKEAVLTGFAAEAEPPMMMGNKAELSATICATVFLLDHEGCPSEGILAVASCVASSDSEYFRAGDA